MRRLPLLLGVAAALVTSGSVAAQGYRLRVDTRWQTAAYRGVTLDSIPVADTVIPPGSGPVSPDGFAVRCLPGAAYCTFFRPGAIRRGGPATSAVEASIWGFGIRGLSVRAAARVGVDLGTADVWPGTNPAVQLLEGYAEYAVPRLTARLGRQVIPSRLGMTGFDGAGVTVRDAPHGIELQGYGGWGLARGAALPVTSPALDPLDDFQPLERQLIVGVGGGWTSARVDTRVVYQREVDPHFNKFVSERVGFDGALRLARDVRISGGADYDLAAGWWGSAEASVAYVTPRVRGTLGARRYRPHFDLWTIWGAFSPVPYRALQATVAYSALSRVELRGRYERYRYDEAATETPLFSAKQDGWRSALGMTVTPVRAWTLDADYQREFGPGASVAGAAAAISYQPSPRIRASLLGSSFDRPLEFRFNDVGVRTLGLDAQFVSSERFRIGLTAYHYSEAHHRPDAAAFDWNHWRASARVSFTFGEGDPRGLPPAIRMLPGDRSAR